ncbi:MAG: DNA helicase UvrD [Chloroflexi bacterium HGW-Chloroflexi-5]|jgi:DNA helicase-2/ATP-dependent DNA helicase PcrA|nr:MAG: DNA helicase UvrD [Chloroflexi bacterium HGW-Chloroflexi-5]
MKFFGDFHIHSHYSRATSKELTPEHLELSGRIKGLQVIGTGDFTHAGWLAELKEKLEPAEEGLFRLKDEYKLNSFIDETLPVRFLLSAEISNIYKKGDKVRKVHNVILAPDFETAEKINRQLESLGGNLRSDGRPILGLDSRDLLEIALEANENIFFFPAHIWTPWFSAMGSKSGFDSIQECYADLAPHIHAIETGLSTDAPMNWMVSSLDGYTLLSNSDAHSPEKLGRNANYFDTELSYGAITDAIASGNGFLGTVDTYPQVGKYHYDGHRKCNVCFDPVKTIEHRGRCPVCGRGLTIGVMSRIAKLCNRTDVEERPDRKAFYPIIPLKELIAEIEGASPASKKVEQRYAELLKKLGNETHILMEKSIDDVAAAGEKMLAAALQRMRERRVNIAEGFDGEYGTVNVFQKGEVKELNAGEMKERIDEKLKENTKQQLKKKPKETDS